MAFNVTSIVSSYRHCGHVPHVDAVYHTVRCHRHRTVLFCPKHGNTLRLTAARERGNGPIVCLSICACACTQTLAYLSKSYLLIMSMGFFLLLAHQFTSQIRSLTFSMPRVYTKMIDPAEDVFSPLCSGFQTTKSQGKKSTYSASRFNK